MKTEIKTLPDGIYSFNGKYICAIKKVENNEVSLNGGIKISVADYIDKYKYTDIKLVC